MKYVYMFSEGNKDMRNILGGKGANLAEMTNLGLPIPQGFTISTEACLAYYQNEEVISDDDLDGYGEETPEEEMLLDDTEELDDGNDELFEELDDEGDELLFDSDLANDNLDNDDDIIE